MKWLKKPAIFIGRKPLQLPKKPFIIFHQTQSTEIAHIACNFHQMQNTMSQQACNLHQMPTSEMAHIACNFHHMQNTEMAQEACHFSFIRCKTMKWRNKPVIFIRC